MKRIFFLCLLSFFIAAELQAAGIGHFVSCNKMNPMPEIVFKTSYGKLKTDFSHTTNQLTAESTEGKGEKEPGVYTAGLARKGFGWYIYVSQAEVKYVDDKTYCVLPTKIEAYLGMVRTSISVSSDIPKESCRFALVLRHEQIHQWINKLTLEYFLPIYYKEVQKTVREVRAVKVSSRDEVQEGMKKLNEYYKARLEPIYNQFYEAVAGEHKKLDNWVNYNAEDKLCREFDEKQKLLNQTFD